MVLAWALVGALHGSERVGIETTTETTRRGGRAPNEAVRQVSHGSPAIDTKTAVITMKVSTGRQMQTTSRTQAHVGIPGS